MVKGVRHTHADNVNLFPPVLPFPASSYTLFKWQKMSRGTTFSSGRHSSTITISSCPTVHMPFDVKHQHTLFTQQSTAIQHYK